MSPLEEMLPLLNRNWKFRFLMRWKRGFLILERTVFLRKRVMRGAGRT